MKPVFRSGKYFGKLMTDVAKMDPQYVVDVYETHLDNGGIPRETYRLAITIIEDVMDVDLEPAIGPEDLEDFGV